MNRVSRRSAEEAAEALLEAGRSQPSLDYDVDLGLKRHHDWLRNDAPVPEWASASVGIAPQSFVAVLIKTIVSSMLVGVLATAAWQARSLLQPRAAVDQASPDMQVAPANAQEGASPDDSLALKPIPVPEQVLPSEQPVRATARAEAHDKRALRVLRSHKDHPSTRVASSRGEPSVTRTEPARAEAVAPASTPTSEDISPAAVTRREVAPAPERTPISTVRKPVPESAPQAPGDLVEMQEVATAEQLLERSPARALALVRQGDQRFARGYFQQERAYIAIMALIRLGRIEEARSRAASFDKHFPALPYGARIHSALEARKAAPPSAAAR